MSNTIDQIITVSVGLVLYQAMQLDAISDSYGITVARKGNRLRISATAANLRRFAQACHADSWNCDPRYARSAAAGRDAIHKALAKVAV